jgi:tetratricopeptide (TPR) repeat protein
MKARQGRIAEALELYKSSVDTNPEFAEGCLYLAKAYLDEGRSLDQALTYARKGLTLDPEGEISPMGHFVIGSALMRQGKAAEAARELAKGQALEAKLAKKK